MAVTNRSALHSKPTKVLLLTHLAGVTPARHELGRLGLAIGSDTIWLNRKEEAEFRRACTAMAAPQPYPAGVQPATHCAH